MTERADSTGRKSPREAGNSRVGEGSSPSRRVNGDTLLRQGSSQIPSKGRWIKRTEIVKYFKRTTTSEQYYDNGLLEFSHPPVRNVWSLSSVGVIVARTLCFLSLLRLICLCVADTTSVSNVVRSWVSSSIYMLDMHGLSLLSSSVACLYWWYIGGSARCV